MQIKHNERILKYLEVKRALSGTGAGIYSSAKHQKRREKKEKKCWIGQYSNEKPAF